MLSRLPATSHTVNSVYGDKNNDGIRDINNGPFSASSILGVLLLGGVVAAYAGYRTQKNKVD